MTHNGNSALPHIIRDRVINASRDAIKSEDPTYKGQIAAGGAIAYALLEVVDAIHEHTEVLRPKPELEPLWKHTLRRRRDKILNKLTAKL